MVGIVKGDQQFASPMLLRTRRRHWIEPLESEHGKAAVIDRAAEICGPTAGRRVNSGPADPPFKRSFAPMVDSDTRLLVLGSLPGEISLAHKRYYAHPRNQFWLLMSDVIGVDLAALDYDARLVALRWAYVGLWDVVETASRSGSLDANIREHRLNRLAELAAALPRLRAVAFNGATSAALGRRELVDIDGLALLALPSSSPAYTLPLAEKRQRWLALQPFVRGGACAKS